MAPRRPELTGVRRLAAAWRRLAAEQRAVLVAALALLATMLLPWYSRTVNTVGVDKVLQRDEAKLAITVFSFVEAAIFLVSIGVILLILARGDRRPFHLPGGDGTIVTIAGAWATFLIFFRFVDQPKGTSNDKFVVDYGLSWGIFFGLLAALALLASGLRLRAAQLAEPALAGTVRPSDGPSGAPTARRRASAPAPPAAQEPGATSVTRVATTPATAATTVLPAGDADQEATTVSDPEQAAREERRRARDERRRGEEPAENATPATAEAPTDARPAHDPDSFRPPEFELPPRPPREE